MRATIASTILVTAATPAALLLAAPTPAAAAPASPSLYVVESGCDRVASVPLGSTAVAATAATGAGPGAIALSPDGSTAFVSDSDGSVARVALDSGPVTAPSTPPHVGTALQGLAFAPDGATVWVVDSGGHQITGLAPGDGSIKKSIVTGLSPQSIAISPDGATAYVTNSTPATITPIDLKAGSAGSPIPVGPTPQGVAITPDGATLFVVSNGGNSVVPVSTANNSPATPITVGKAPTQIAITPDGTKAYVANSGDASITVINVATKTVLKTVPMPLGDIPSALTVSPDGSTVWVSSEIAGAVVPIRTADNSIDTAGEITGLCGPTGLAVTPDQAPVAHLTASATSVPAGTTVSFDASASTVQYGAITAYQFSFGDGTPAVVSTAPTVSHTYTKSGTFPATVFEVDTVGTSYRSVFTGQTMSRNAPKTSLGVPQDEAGVYVTVTTSTSPTISQDQPVVFTTQMSSGKLVPVGLNGDNAPTVSAGVPTGGGAASTAVAPDGSALVVANYTANTLTPVSVCPDGTGALSFAVAPGSSVNTGSKPSMVAIAPTPVASVGTQTTWTAYVVDNGSNDVRSFALTVDSATCLASLRSIATITLPSGSAPYGIAITPDASLAFVSNSATHSVTPIDLHTRALRTPVPVGLTPQGIAVTPDGGTVYVANSGSNSLTAISRRMNATTHTETDVPATPISVGRGPSQVAIDPDGAHVYVTNATDASFSVLTIASQGLVTKAFPAGYPPTSVAVAPDGKTVWFSSFKGGALLPYSTASNTLITSRVVTGLKGVVGLALAPDQAPLAQITASSTSVPLGSSVTLDASSSTVRYGTITGYQFYFGDGTSVVSTTPTVTHTYTKAGVFPAVVYEVDTAGTTYITKFTGQTVARYAPKHGTVPTSAAGIYISVTTTAPPATLPSGGTALYLGDYGAGSFVPIGLPAGAPAIVAGAVPTGAGAAFPAATSDGRAAVLTNYAAGSVSAIAVCPDGTGNDTFHAGSGSTVTGLNHPSQAAIDPTPTDTLTETLWNVYVTELGANQVRAYTLHVSKTSCQATLGPSSGVPVQASVIPVGASPYGIVIVGTKAYVTNSGSATVTPIDLTTRTAQPPIPVGVKPEGIAVGSNSMIYVVNNGSNTLTPISTATGVPSPPMQIGTGPVTVATNGSSAFVTDSDSTVSVVNLLTGMTKVLTMPNGVSATAVAVSADGSTAWISSYSGAAIVPLDAATSRFLTGSVIGGFVHPLGLATTTTP